MDKKYYACVVGAAVLWGMVVIFVKLLTAAGLNSIEIVAVRAGFSACLLVGYLLWRDRRALCIRWRDGWYFVGTGIVSMVFFNYCYFSAIKESGISVAATLLYTSPIFVTLFSALLFKERLTTRKLLAVTMTFGGCVLVTGLLQERVGVSLYAVLLGLSSGIGYALYSIFGKYALARYNSLTVTVYTFIFGSIGIAPFIDWAEWGAALARPEIWSAGVGIAIIGTILPYLLYTYGLTGIETSRAAVLATIEPMVAATIGIVLYGEDMNLLKLLGMMMIFSSVILLNRAKT